MGVTTHEAQRPARTPLELARSIAAPASTPRQQVSLASPASPASPVSPAAQRHPTAAPSLIVIVAASRAEQQRLLASIPADVPVLVTTSAEQAEALLHTLPLRTAPGAGPTHGPGTAPVTLLTSTPTPAPTSTPTGMTPSLPGPTVRAAERTVSWAGGHSVRLTPLEFALLQTLISDQGRVWSFAELSTKVWATGFVGDGAQVRAVVKRLRRKLGEAQAPVMVETVRGSGFRLASRPSPCVT
ncbi:winged helix-turn-helix domain-containing protein [Ornithinimicrobium sufpigmenti]|uniref:winged helix-turn-helix domain-containing protein n=1 Tax=Ornithinimicrobium sufpigmenti TaxID=2508882 RepID=UPI001036073B|nr:MULTISPECIES: winged helix-turn-helix domain-containing protein [unclassified Ornithinimicrobium]